MDKWFYIEVQTYQSVNKMGLELGHYVEKKYDHTVVHKDCIPDIYDDIKAKKEELEEKYPRSRPFKYEKREYKDRWQERLLRYLLSLTALITTIIYLSSELAQSAR